MKLVVLIALPSLIAVFLAFSQISENQKMASDLGKMEQLTGLAAELSALVHEVQKERGTTRMFLGSGGLEHGLQLEKQRMQTDSRFDSVASFRSTFETAEFGSEFESQITGMSAIIEDFSDHRGWVDTLDPTVGDALAFYTQFNAQALNIVATLGELAPSTETSQMSSAYANFLQSKERAGIERAVLGTAFSRGKFAQGEFARFNKLVSAQDAYMAVFKTFTRPQDLSYFEELMDSSYVDSVYEYRAIAINNVSNDDLGGVTGSEWWDAATGRINLLKKMDDHLATSTTDAVRQLKAEAVFSLWLTAAVVAVSLVVAIAAAALISSVISNAVGRVSRSATDLAETILPDLVNLMKNVASGDLSRRSNFNIARVDSSGSDEFAHLAQAFNEMSDQIESVGNGLDEMVVGLTEVVGQVVNTATDVTAASEQLAAASEEAGKATQNIADQAQGLSGEAITQQSAVGSATESVRQLGSAIEQIASGAQNQIESVDSASRTIEEVSKAISGVATSAQRAASESETADNAAIRGLHIVQQTVDGMEKINIAVSEVADRVGNLGEQSAEIGSIVAVINDIAAQTNLLALNAAIEAARAGEQGRGFAVVADEVRQLAERVTAATSEIADLIDGVQSGVDQSIEATGKGTAEVERGSNLASEAGESLNEIQTAVRSVSSQVEQISVAAEQVTASSDEMVASVESVSVITEETTAATEQMSASNDQVQNAMNSIHNATRESGASIEETSAATEELSAQVEQVVASSSSLGDMAGTLMGAVSVFKLASENDSGDEKAA